ncbi:MAG: DUF2867 domain-containing protein [Saprospiraceae bacterium]|nr:DUF2867 domain-containing protein [Lewinella sp.]
MNPYPVRLPQQSVIISALDRIDYEDAFAVKVPGPVAVEELPPLFFKVFPKWFGVLMYLREAIAGLIGLKTGKGVDVKKQMREFTGEVGESIALFHVLGRSKEEIMTGENDRHLDFRLSFFARPAGEQSELTLATTVQYNALLGKLYFLPVRPVHRFIVPVILKRIARALGQAQQASAIH